MTRSTSGTVGATGPEPGVPKIRLENRLIVALLATDSNPVCVEVILPGPSLCGTS